MGKQSYINPIEISLKYNILYIITVNSVEIFIMVRVDILLSKDDKVPKKLVDALQVELEKRIHKYHDDAIVRVRISSSKSVDVSGCNKDDKDKLLKIIENVFNSDDWIPE